jgi:hypothetical protein
MQTNALLALWIVDVTVLLFELVPTFGICFELQIDMASQNQKCHY